jgi:ABC-2 type transport system ATP-binding protein
MIEAEGLTKYYGPMPAIRDVSFTVERGEVVGFLGPNGAGKSTTMRILTCYMPPTAGVARIDGLDCFDQSLEVRRRVGYLPENVPLYGELTVRGFLRFAAGAKGVESKKIESEVNRAVGVCGLEQAAHRMISHLSKGFRQRVGLAQALLNNPSVLVLDEPTIGLDPTQIIEIRRLIQELREEHTVLLSSHILPEVAQICQRVLIINKGQIIATDSPANLTSQLQKSAQVQLQIRGNTAELASALESLGGVQKVTVAEGETGRVFVETDRSGDLRPEIARLVVDKRMDLLELKLVDLSLEEIFMQLVTDEASLEDARS